MAEDKTQIQSMSKISAKRHVLFLSAIEERTSKRCLWESNICLADKVLVFHTFSDPHTLPALWGFHCKTFVSPILWVERCDPVEAFFWVVLEFLNTSWKAKSARQGKTQKVVCLIQIPNTLFCEVWSTRDWTGTILCQCLNSHSGVTNERPCDRYVV